MPKPKLGKKQLRLFYVVDASGSMAHKNKIIELNKAMAISQGEIRNIAERNPQANVMIQVLRFSDSAKWLEPEPEPIRLFEWKTINADKLVKGDRGFMGEMGRLLEEAGATEGKLEIALTWFNKNDLDLHVTCPCNTHIYYSKKKCDTCGGWLDVDMNVNLSKAVDNPVEHITFGYTKDEKDLDVKKGRYKISVKHFKNHLRAHQTKFKWAVKGPLGEMKSGSGVLGSDGVEREVCQLDVNEEFLSDDGSGGNTNFGLALEKLNEALTEPKHPDRAIAPIIILLSDGNPTDEFQNNLDILLASKWGSKAQKYAISIGEDVDIENLRKFTTDPQNVFEAKNAQDLSDQIRWVSTQPLSDSLAGKTDEERESYGDSRHVESSEEVGADDRDKKSKDNDSGDWEW